MAMTPVIFLVRSAIDAPGDASFAIVAAAMPRGSTATRRRPLMTTVECTRTGAAMASTDKPEFEIHEEVIAENVEIKQAGAAVVKADTVSVTQGGIQSVEAKKVSVERGGAFAVAAEAVNLTNSGAGFISSESAKLNNSRNAFMVTDTVKAKNSTIGVLLAGSIEGTPDVKMDARSAAAFGAGAAIALFLLRRIFSRS